MLSKPVTVISQRLIIPIDHSISLHRLCSLFSITVIFMGKVVGKYFPFITSFLRRFSAWAWFHHNTELNSLINILSTCQEQSPSSLRMIPILTIEPCSDTSCSAWLNWPTKCLLNIVTLIYKVKFRVRALRRGVFTKRYVLSFINRIKHYNAFWIWSVQI